jgi:hypothetical protein
MTFDHATPDEAYRFPHRLQSDLAFVLHSYSASLPNGPGASISASHGEVVDDLLVTCTKLKGLELRLYVQTCPCAVHLRWQHRHPLPRTG